MKSHTATDEHRNGCLRRLLWLRRAVENLSVGKRSQHQIKDFFKKIILSSSLVTCLRPELYSSPWTWGNSSLVLQSMIGPATAGSGSLRSSHWMWGSRDTGRSHTPRTRSRCRARSRWRSGRRTSRASGAPGWRPGGSGSGWPPGNSAVPVKVRAVS